MPSIHFLDPAWAMPPLLVPRTPQASTDSSSTTTNSSETSDRSALAKSIIEWVLISTLFILVGVLLVRRFMYLRQSHQPLRNFFTRRSRRTETSTTQPNPSAPSRISFPSPYVLHQLQTNFDPRPRRGATAFDVDASGRRLAPAGEMVLNDHDGAFNDKDVLPAYDGTGRPPKYFELHTSGHGGGPAQQPTSQGMDVQNTGGGAQVGTDGVPSNISPNVNETNPSPAYEVSSNHSQATDLREHHLPSPSMCGHSPASGVDPSSTSLPSAPQPTTTSPPPS